MSSCTLGIDGTGLRKVGGRLGFIVFSLSHPHRLTPPCLPPGLRPVLDGFGPEVAELTLRNMIFPGTGTSGTNEGKVVARYTLRHRHAVVAGREKSLVRPDAVAFLWAHFASRLACGRTHEMPPEMLRANHYTGAVVEARNQTCPGEAGCVSDETAVAGYGGPNRSTIELGNSWGRAGPPH